MSLKSTDFIQYSNHIILIQPVKRYQSVICNVYNQVFNNNKQLGTGDDSQNPTHKLPSTFTCGR